MQPDGKMVIASVCDRGGTYRICLIRLTASGALDTFGTMGLTVTPLTTTYSHYSARLALAEDGKIIVATACVLSSDLGTSRFCVARFTANGVLDVSFGDAGVVTTTMSVGTHPYDTPVAVFIRPAGEIVVAGNCQSVGDPLNPLRRVCSARFTAISGALDVSYGSGGRAFHHNATWTASDIYAYAAIMTSNGSLRFAGNCVTAVQSGCVIATNGDGTLANGFGVQGLVVLNLASASTLLGVMAQQRDGKLIVGGACNQIGESSGLLCLTRLNASSGAIDVTFSPNFVNNGIVRTAVPDYSNVYFTSLALDGDGTILAAGACNGNSVPEVACIIRYRPEGYLDTSFTANGILSGVVANFSSVSGSAIAANGRILLAGSCNVNNAGDTCVAALEGGPQTFSRCSLDLDGDGTVSATDSLIFSRAMFGFDLSHAIAGVSFPAAATRNTLFSIREYLSTQCGVEVNQPIR